MKKSGRRIAMLTAYDTGAAMLAERAGAPVLLVGDSVGMVVHGFDTTLPVTLDMMVAHSAAVVRGSSEALVVADLPFLTYSNEATAVASAGRLFQQAGVGAVKLEGGAEIAATVAKLVQLGMPVMGHLGYTPQSTHQIGLKVQAKAPDDAAKLIADAVALEAAGAGAGCDGQVQVWHDVLGLYPTAPRHARRFGEIGTAIEQALRDYVQSVEAGAFPSQPAVAKPAVKVI